jgi:transcriptional regulator with XRE-family HTH domain
MSSIKQNLIDKFGKRSYRESFVSSHLSGNIAAQIALMRGSRGWSQEDLAERADMKQSRISLMENPSYEGFNLKTLRRLAAAFDVALIVRFVPYGELLAWALNVDESDLTPESFDDDPAFEPAPLEPAEGSAISALGVDPILGTSNAIGRFGESGEWKASVPPRLQPAQPQPSQWLH